ncbi:MAG: TIGR04053 family radical SAM/SPASM domain-containing protein [Actinomycetota bacterium]
MATSTRHGLRAIRALRHDPARRPFLVIWELTRACDLACQHCRAVAKPERDPDELTTEEGYRLLEEIVAFGRPPPLFVMTGGDPLKRPDLLDLIRAARSLGLPVAVAPSATPALTGENLGRLREAGVTALSLSVDGSVPHIHDGFRGVPGVFDATMSAWREARRLGFHVQINTTVSGTNLPNLADIARIVYREGAMTWSVFSLVPTGRGVKLRQLGPSQGEDVLHFLYDVNHTISVKTTEAPAFRRVSIQRRILEEHGRNPVTELGLGDTYLRLRAGLRAVGLAPGDGEVKRPPLPVSAGSGFLFISHTGDVSPSGFLPLAAGNVRRRSLADIYRTSPLFTSLRDPDLLKGRCGRCEFAAVCGGSRSRAFAMTGDPLQEEGSCAYEPGSFGFSEDVALYAEQARWSPTARDLRP